MPADACSSLDALPEHLDGCTVDCVPSRQAADEFSFLAPLSYLRKARNSEDGEALLRQVLPRAEELLDVPGFSRDPLLESPKENDGLIEKYPGRLLLMVTQACSGHCRFCFRRHFLDTPIGTGRIMAAFRERMARKGDISELILSGGDPLVLSDRRIEAWLQLAGEYPQLQRIRIHTREPVFSPERITAKLAEVISASPLPVIMAVHVNHATELDAETAEALARLKRAGAILLTQTVLLRGVNDSSDRLADLFERAVECGMVPYYLHQLDRVAGAAHFEVPREKGLEIVEKLRDRLPGYMVPRFVEEVAGEAGKRPVA